MSDLEVQDPGHESLPDDYTTQFRSIPAQRSLEEISGVRLAEEEPDPLVVQAAFDYPTARLLATAAWQWPAQLWVNYRAGLMTRAALSDQLAFWPKVRLTAELWLVTLAFGLFWTVFVIGGVTLLAGLIGLL